MHMSLSTKPVNSATQQRKKSHLFLTNKLNHSVKALNLAKILLKSAQRRYRKLHTPSSASPTPRLHHRPEKHIPPRRRRTRQNPPEICLGAKNASTFSALSKRRRRQQRPRARFETTPLHNFSHPERLLTFCQYDFLNQRENMASVMAWGAGAAVAAFLVRAKTSETRLRQNRKHGRELCKLTREFPYRAVQDLLLGAALVAA